MRTTGDFVSFELAHTLQVINNSVSKVEEIRTHVETASLNASFLFLGIRKLG